MNSHRVVKSAPRQRLNDTTRKTNIFELDLNLEKQLTRPSPTRVSPNFMKSEIFSPMVHTPTQRVRVTNRSDIFTPEGKEILDNKNPFFLKQGGLITTPRKINPHKPIDQPTQSFFLVEQQEKLTPKRLLRQEIPSNIKNNYSGRGEKQQIISVTSTDKKQLDMKSSIFYDCQHYKLERPKQEPHQNLLYTEEWSSPHIGSLKTDVNEKASFDKSYARNKYYQEYKSSLLTQSPHNLDKTPSPRINYDQVNQPNASVKKVNQAYSDMFDQEFGHKDRQSNSKNSSISQNQIWSEFDSIRNAIDMRYYQQVLFNFNLEGIKAIDKVSGLTSVFDAHVLKNKTDESLQTPTTNKLLENDEFKTVKSGKKNNDHQVNQQTKRPSTKPIIYEGIYKWKNNYKK